MGTNKPPNAEQNAFALNCLNPGLTKRELIAALLMQSNIQKWGSNVSRAELAETSIKDADELLKQLSQ